MALLSLQNVTVRMGGDPLLEDVVLHVERGQRACLTGRNGCGKSTLLKLLAGLLEPDGGQIVRTPGLRVAYLPQDVPEGIRGTVRSVVDREGDGSVDAFRAHAQAAEEAISRLGLEPELPFETLSGGMKRRALLARALACSPDLLLLDEPTNHLDLSAIEWLESYLCRANLTVLFVTHDRTFLRRVASRILDLDRGELAGWDCDYDTFLRRKQQLLEDEAAMWEKKGKRLSQEEIWIRKGIKARRTRDEGRVRALLALRETFRQRRLQEGASQMTLQQAARSGELVVKTQGLTFGYPGSPPLLAGLDLQIMRGEKIGIVGPNGAGKTTLLRLLLGELSPQQGSVQLGTRLEVARLDQLRGALDGDKTILENLTGDGEYVEVNGQRRHAYGYLQEFLFTPARARMPVRVLSGGEQNRLLLAMVFTRPFNFLIMDEPTNDLDLETLELLEEQLQQHPATMMLVSHDRTFLNQTVTRMLVFEGDGKVGAYAGGYDDWLVQRAKAVAVEEPEPRRTKAPAPKQVRGRKLTNRESRDLAEMGNRIEALEQEQADLLEAQQDPAFYRLAPEEIARRQARLTQLAEEIERSMERWAELESMQAGTS